MKMTASEFKKKHVKQSANKLTKAIIKHLRLVGWKVWRQNNGGVYDPVKKVFRKDPQHEKGVSDIIGFNKITGTFIAVEVKVGSDTLSKEQREFIDSVNKAGGIGFVARTFDQFLAAYSTYAFSNLAGYENQKR